MDITEQKILYESLTHQIEREDGLVNTRLTWMLTTQGFLIASLAIIADAGKVREQMFLMLKFVIPITGVFLSIFGYYGVRGANIALDGLKEKWCDELEDNPVFIRPFGGIKASKYGRIPSTFLPWLFVFVWLSILTFVIVL